MKLPGAGELFAWMQSLPAGLDQPHTAIGSITPAGKLPCEPRARAVASTETSQALNPIAWPMIAWTCWLTFTWTPTAPVGIVAPLLLTAPMSASAPFTNCAVQVQLPDVTQLLSVSDLSTAAQTALWARELST